MADKLQLRTKFTSQPSGSTTRTIEIGKTTSSDSELKAFRDKLGTFVSQYSLVESSKIETTSLDG